MKRKADFRMRKVGGENVLLPLGSEAIGMNGLLTMSDTAAQAWDLLAEERTLGDLTAAVMERFDVDAGIARADMQVFVDELARLGLLEA